MRIYQRKNRKTKGIIELHHERDLLQDVALWMDWYWCECEHGGKSWKASRKSNAIHDMAHPDEWCKRCAKTVRALTTRCT